jgi:hypothetical protein
MACVVYVNNPTNKAMVHKTSCYKYLNRRRDKTPNGYWIKPYTDFKGALAFAQSTGKKILDTCSICFPPNN